MGVLRQHGQPRWASLGARTLVGRAQFAGLHLPDRFVAGEQALLQYSEDRWLVRDLASRNGTFVKGERLEPGQARELAVGDVVRFASPEQTWELVDDGPPGPAAVQLGTDHVVVGSHLVLGLPDEEAMEASILPAGERWMVEQHDASAPVEDGEVLNVAGASYAVLLPVNLDGSSLETLDSADAADVGLDLHVSPDGDDVVHATVSVAGRTTPLEVRSHLQLILTLARARIHDAGRQMPMADRGWLTVDAACRQTPVAIHLVATHVHRARRQLAEAGVPAFERLVEHRGRRPHRQIRLGLSRVRVHVA